MFNLPHKPESKPSASGFDSEKAEQREWMRSGGSSKGVPAAAKDMKFVSFTRKFRIKAQRSGFDSEKEEQGSEGSFRQKAKPGAGNGAERTLLRRHPQSAVSMGIICFFRLITLGRKM